MAKEERKEPIDFNLKKENNLFNPRPPNDIKIFDKLELIW